MSTTKRGTSRRGKRRRSVNPAAVQSRDDNVTEYDQEVPSKRLRPRPVASTSKECSQRQGIRRKQKAINDAKSSASTSATPRRGRSRGRMKQEHEDIIQTNWDYLLKEIDAEYLKDHMFTKHILDHDDLDEIGSEKTKKKRTEIFMSKLLRAGPDAYDVFIAALEEAGYHQAVEKLRKESSVSLEDTDVTETARGMPDVCETRSTAHAGGNGTTDTVKTESQRFSNLKNFSLHQLKDFDPTKYPEIEAYNQAEEHLNNLGLVTLFGPPGSGKTTAAWILIARIYEKSKIHPLVLTDASEIDDIPVHEDMKEAEYVILLDDIFGKSSLVKRYKESWEQKFDKILNMIEYGLIKVIITFTSVILYDSQRSDCRIYSKINPIDLQDLTTEEKINILDYHLKCKKIEMSLDNMHVAVRNYVGGLSFPLCCSFYVASSEAQSQGPDFFKRPSAYVHTNLKQIKRDMSERSQYLYLVLLLVMFNQGVLRDDYLQGNTVLKLIKKIQRHCRVKHTSLPYIKQTADSLCGTYLRHCDVYKRYEFIDQSVCDALFKTFSEDHFKESITICPVETLLECVVTTEVANKSTMTVVVDRNHYSILANRFTDLLKSKQARLLLLHPSLKYEEFTNFLTHICWKDEVPTEIVSCKLDCELHPIGHWRVRRSFWNVNPKEYPLSMKTCELDIYSNKYLCYCVSSYPSSVLASNDSTPLLRYVLNRLDQFNDDQKEELLDLLILKGNDRERIKFFPKQNIVFSVNTLLAATGSKSDNVSLVCALMKKMNVEWMERKKVDLIQILKTLLMLAIDCGNEKISSFLMDEMHGMGDMQPIFRIARRILLIRCHTCVKTTDNKSQFFERGAVNLFTQLYSYETEYSSETEVYLAAGHRSAGILKEIVHRHPSCLNVDDGCETVLHSAARYGCVESVKFLKENGCDVNASNKQKQTPLHVAAENNQPEIISYLLSVGADHDVEDADGKTPLHLASIAHSSASVKAIKEHIDQIKSLKQSPKAKKQKRKGKQETKYKRYKKNPPKPHKESGFKIDT